MTGLDAFFADINKRFTFKPAQDEDDRYEDDSLREEQELLERIDRHIINQEQI